MYVACALSLSLFVSHASHTVLYIHTHTRTHITILHSAHSCRVSSGTVNDDIAGGGLSQYGTDPKELLVYFLILAKTEQVGVQQYIFVNKNI